MAYFVFLEFADPEICKFLCELRSAFGNSDTTSPVHVTLRGPYERSPSLEQVEAFAERMRGYGVRIGGHGYFSTDKGFAIFLRAECTVFREVWDKPDYRTPLDSIQPHITVFESSDRTAAQEVRSFLRREALLIHTHNVYLRIYKTRSSDNQQTDLFGPPVAFPSVKPVMRDMWRIQPDVLKRARALGTKLSKATGVQEP